jgi:hypothetical protein
MNQSVSTVTGLPDLSHLAQQASSGFIHQRKTRQPTHTHTLAGETRPFRFQARYTPACTATLSSAAHAAPALSLPAPGSVCHSPSKATNSPHRPIFRGSIFQCVRCNRPSLTSRIHHPCTRVCAPASFTTPARARARPPTRSPAASARTQQRMLGARPSVAAARPLPSPPLRARVRAHPLARQQRQCARPLARVHRQRRRNKARAPRARAPRGRRRARARLRNFRRCRALWRCPAEWRGAGDELLCEDADRPEVGSCAVAWHG